MAWHGTAFGFLPAQDIPPHLPTTTPPHTPPHTYLLPRKEKENNTGHGQEEGRTMFPTHSFSSLKKEGTSSPPHGMTCPPTLEGWDLPLSPSVSFIHMRTTAAGSPLLVWLLPAFLPTTQALAWLGGTDSLPLPAGTSPHALPVGLHMPMGRREEL